MKYANVKKFVFLVLVGTSLLAPVDEAIAGCSYYQAATLECDTIGEAAATCAAAVASGQPINAGYGSAECRSIPGADTIGSVWWNNSNPDATFAMNVGGYFLYKWVEGCQDDVTPQSTASPAPAMVCSGFCQYALGGSGVNVCGSAGCSSMYTGTAQMCDGSEGGGVPAGCTVSPEGTVVCDCTANPGAAYCGTTDNPDCETIEGVTTCYAPSDPNNPQNRDNPEDPDGGGGNPGDPNDSGGNNGGGGTGNTPNDGDPDTPANTGGGDGDTDGDDERDVDCDPFSNPDCAFAGGASASAVCGLPPSCSGEPVACASLLQSYNVMCAVLKVAQDEVERQKNKTASNSSNCTIEPVCTSDNVIECKAMIQTWRNTCMALDLKGEKAPWEAGSAEFDTYNTDLSDTPTEVDLTTGVDQSGFASGSCPAPMSTSAFGAAIDIDFGAICDVAGIIRVFVIIMSLMWAAPFIVRSF